jgi:molybdopterin-containing oxidoreductase family iron-sulfur binding subunit
MHWLRIDRYFEGAVEDPKTVFQPVLCMHCDNAPCEVVCPANATSHHEEGMNDMVYNRCVGTKFCANNCPYKVRRYNFFGYATDAVSPLDPQEPTVKMSHNPDVTVRTYGVMEKCSYCVQRINYARNDAKKRGERIRDGEMMTACQAACPAQAIHFGDMNDRGSDVTRQKADRRGYALLAELNTEPRTTYLARLRNPSAALPEPEPEDKHG